MRIEIILGQEANRTYYQIERNELILGSSNQCDVVLPRPEISRRHLSLLVRGDRYFVIDHSSTNGTFLNEEKITPGQKTEWKTYIPMRLGTGVIITLVEDAADEEEIYSAPVNESSKSDQTRTIVIPLAQLKAAAAKKKPLPRKRTVKKKKGMGMTYLFVAAILGFAYYLNVNKGFKFDSSKLRGKRSSSPQDSP